MICTHRLRSSPHALIHTPSAAHLKLSYTVYCSSGHALSRRLGHLTSSSATPSSAAQPRALIHHLAQLPQALLHRLAQLTSALPLPSSMAHLKLCPHRLAQLTSCSATPSSAAHIKLCYTVYAAHLMLCYTV